jgi:transcriptional regulator with XRE-family HTH domain
MPFVAGEEEVSPRNYTQEIEFVDRFGEKRIIRKRDRAKWAVKQDDTQAWRSLNEVIATLMGQKIRDAREAAGLSMSQLAARIGVNGHTYNQKVRMYEIEKGVRKYGLRFGTLYAIAMVLGVDPKSLMPTTDEILGRVSVKYLGGEKAISVEKR